MDSESIEKKYLNRTNQQAESEALPEIFHSLLGSGLYVISDPVEISQLSTGIEKLRKRLSDEPWPEKGVQILNLNKRFPDAKGVLTVEYDSEIEQNLIIEHFKRAYPNMGPEDAIIATKRDFKDYRRITELTLQNESHLLNLKDHLPKGWSLYAYVANRAPLSVSASTVPQARLIFSHQPLDSRYGLYVLFHEIGHGVDSAGQTPEEIAEEIKTRDTKSGTSKEKKVVIQSERNADSFALSNLRHFFGREDMDFFSKLAYTGQRAYHRHIKER